MCLECSGKHRGLGVHISFVRSVTMDSWSEIQLKKMELGGNESFNKFMNRYDISKNTDIVTKYNHKGASIYRDKIQNLAEGKPWRDPPVTKEGPARPPIRDGNSGWDNWDNYDDGTSNNSIMRRNQTVSDFRSGGGGGNGPSRSRSSDDVMRAQYEASAANKDSFFARKMAENGSRPEGLPPSQGGKYVGFGSSPAPVPRNNYNNNNSQGDVFSAVTQGFGRLSMIAASAAQSAATAVQAGSKELGSKVAEGGYDYKVNETVNAVTTKTTEFGQKGWGIMKGVLALASQKVEEFAEGPNSRDNSWERNENEQNGHYKESSQASKGWNSSGGAQSSGRHSNSVSSASWDDWDSKDNRKENSTKGATSSNDNGWAGWDDGKDDGYDNFQSASNNKRVAHGGKSESKWTDGGFL